MADQTYREYDRCYYARTTPAAEGKHQALNEQSGRNDTLSRRRKGYRLRQEMETDANYEMMYGHIRGARNSLKSRAASLMKSEILVVNLVN